MGELELRHLQVADAPRVASLAKELGYVVSVDEAATRIEALGDDSCAFIGLVAGEVVGWIQATNRQLLQERRVLEIGGLVVAEASRGSGVGRLLIEAVEQWGRDRDHDQLFVRSSVAREDAHGFYEFLGFSNKKTSYTFLKEIE